MIKLIICLVFFILYVSLVIVATNNSDSEIVLVNVVFRHGERTVSSFYPNDPYKNKTFFPIGLGGLTNKGKLMMFKLGEKLKKLYGYLLGDEFQEGKVYVKSTNTTRTKMSALLVLAGLWPPNGSQKWHPTLNWQPIPIDVKSREEESVLSPICQPLHEQLRLYYKNSTIFEKYITPYKKLFEYVQIKSGQRVNDFIDINRLYISLKCEEDYGLELPNWTKDIYPEILYEAASFVYQYTNLERKFRIFNSGYLMKKIIDDMVLKINNTLTPKDRKLFMYSGHDTNVAHVLCNLKLNCNIPDYGSTVIFELHKKFEKFFVRIQYLQNPLNPVIKSLTIPDCETFCPIEHFIKLQMENDYIPNTSKKECK